MVYKQTKLAKEQKRLRWKMSHVHTLESRIETEKDYAIFMGRFAGELIIKIDTNKATEVFGDYFPDFWATYTATDYWGAELAVTSSRKLKGGKNKELITNPQLLAQGLGGAVKYLIETRDERRYKLRDICEYASKLKDSKLTERIAKLIADYGGLTYSELADLAKKTKNLYLLNKAGEVMIKEGEQLSQLNQYEDIPKNVSAEKPAKSQSFSDIEGIDFAADVYRKAWKSARHVDVDKNSKAYKPSKTFMKQEYDNSRLMKRALGKLTGYTEKGLTDFEDKVYGTLNRIFDWNYYSKWIAGYKKSEARRK